MADKKASSSSFSSSSLYELRSHQSRLAMLFLKARDYKKTLEIARTIVSRSPNSAATLGILGILQFVTAISPAYTLNTLQKSMAILPLP
ncbi:hypothetical protein CFP56_013215 [Quercus suber]|uniref:Uncharacterized protein n=1 Tax=Quercus suber TaxID=58331 RepID=A0AAW0KU87_QUESU